MEFGFYPLNARGWLSANCVANYCLLSFVDHACATHLFSVRQKSAVMRSAQF